MCCCCRRAPGCIEEFDFLRAMLLQRGRISFILRELNFGTAVLRQLLLQHAHLRIVRDSPCVADVSRATGRVVELDFLCAMLLQRGRISCILRELNFGTAVLRQLLLQHTHLMIVQDSPCVVDVTRAPGSVEEFDFLPAMLTLIAMLPIPHDSSFWALK